MVTLDKSQLEITLQQEIRKLKEGDDGTHLEQLIFELMEELTEVEEQHYSSLSEGRKQLEELALIDRFYYTVESEFGISMSLDTLIDHLRAIRDCRDSSWELADEFDGRFTSRIPWDLICEGDLLHDEGVNRHQISANTWNEAMEISHSTQSGSDVLSLPPETIRHILHLGANSLLPASGSHLYERKILHCRRNHYLTHAALSNSIFRREAQLELVSFAYSWNGSTLNKVLEFIAMSGFNLTALRLDHLGDDWRDFDQVWGKSLARLSPTMEGLSKLSFLDLGGYFESTVMFDSFKRSNLPNLSSIQFSRQSNFTNPRWMESHKLPPSIINMTLDCCGLQPIESVFRFSSNMRRITVTTDPDQYEEDFSSQIWHTAQSNTTSALFSDTTSLNLDTQEQSHILLFGMEFPFVTHVEITDSSHYLWGRPHESASYSRMMRRFFTFPCLEFLLLPAGHQDMIWKCEDGSGAVSVESFTKKGVKIEYKEPVDY